VGEEAEGSSGLRLGRKHEPDGVAHLDAFLLAPWAGITCRISRKGREGLYDLVRPKRADGNVRLGAAPHGARRIDKHRLEVSWTDGKRLFVDKPPYDEPLDGVVGLWWLRLDVSSALGVEKRQFGFHRGVA
jgi:hypothetical protein